MLVPVHAGIGWMLAEAGLGSRRFRQSVLLASVLPDLDGALTFHSQTLYDAYHGHVTHSLLFSLVMSAVAVMFCRKEWLKTLIFTQIAFYLHYFGDYVFSGWPLEYWFPFSKKVFLFKYAFWLGHPINYILFLVSFVVIIVMAWRIKRTPLEAVSAQLDERLCNFLFREKPLVCSYCSRKTNERCTRCGAAVCIRHAPLDASFEPYCIECKGKIGDG